MSDIKKLSLEYNTGWDDNVAVGTFVFLSDHLAALEAAKKEAVFEWLKSIKAKCRIPCDLSCKFGPLCYMRAMYWEDEAIQKAAEV